MCQALYRALPVYNLESSSQQPCDAGAVITPLYEAKRESGWGNSPKLTASDWRRHAITSGCLPPESMLLPTATCLAGQFSLNILSICIYFGLRSDAELQFLVPDAWPTIPTHTESSNFTPQFECHLYHMLNSHTYLSLFLNPLLSHFIPAADVNSLYNKDIIRLLSFYLLQIFSSHIFLMKS